MAKSKATVVGGGLAGTEAAWQLAEAGHEVDLLEMRPAVPTAVHRSDRLAELVCSNSMRGDALANAVGLLKAEMEILDSLIIREARAAAVPAGSALVWVVRLNLETAAMLGSASPLKPSVPMANRSASLAILLVA